MTPVTLRQLTVILTVCGIVLLVAAIAWWRPWRKPAPCCDGGWIQGDRGWRWPCRTHEPRTGGVVGVEDPTPTHGPSDLADIFGGWLCVCGDGSWTKAGCTAPDETPMIVGDFGGMQPLPEALYGYDGAGVELAVANAVVEPVCTCPWNNGYARPGTPPEHHVACPALRGDHAPDDECWQLGIPMCGHRDTWQPAQPGDTPGALVPGEGDTEPQPTLREETVPATAAEVIADGTVKLGRNVLCRACIDHRSNGSYDEICASCRPSLVGRAKPPVTS